MLSAILLVVFSGTGLVYCSEWDYKKHGPSKWSHLPIPQHCGEHEQSPINIDSDKATKITHALLPSIRPFIFSYAAKEMTLKNNGHSVQVDVGGSDLLIDEGGLGPYIPKQFHFHWGKENDHGSEHTIDDKRFPLEMHIVHCKNADCSGDSQDSLAVLSVLFKISDHDNPHLNKVLKHFTLVKDPGQSTEIDPFDFSSLLPSSTDAYYRYDGSLTTPPCSQTVVWSVFKKYNSVSKKQMDEFRGLKDAHHDHLENNFRKLQESHHRIVLEMEPTINVPAKKPK